MLGIYGRCHTCYQASKENLFLYDILYLWFYNHVVLQKWDSILFFKDIFGLNKGKYVHISEAQGIRRANEHCQNVERLHR